MNKLIKKVIYINLEERKDRKRKCLDILDNLFYNDQIVRLDAIKHDKGYIGCAMSHLKCLEIAIENNWENVLIVEDDIFYTKNSKNILINLIKKPFDFIILGGALIYYNPFNYKLYRCNSTTAYIVSNHYYKTLKSFWENNLNNLIKTNNFIKYSLDISWHELQYKDNWKIVYPPVFIQKMGKSDIQQESYGPEKYFYTTNIFTFIRQYKRLLSKFIYTFIILALSFFIKFIYKKTQ